MTGETMSLKYFSGLNVYMTCSCKKKKKTSKKSEVKETTYNMKVKSEKKKKVKAFNELPGKHHRFKLGKVLRNFKVSHY